MWLSREPGEWQGRQWGRPGQDHQIVSLCQQGDGCQVQADTPCEGHQQRAPHPRGFISPHQVEMPQKGQSVRKATGSAALGRLPTHKAGKTENSEGALSTQMGRAPETRRKPGNSGARHREEPGPVSLTHCPGPRLSFFWLLSPLTGHSTDLSTNDSTQPRILVENSNIK